MTEGLPELTVYGVFAYIVIKEAFCLVKVVIAKLNGKSASICEVPPACTDWQHRVEKTIGIMAAETHDLRTWHDVRDSDNVPVWYVRKSLEKSMDSLAKRIEQQNTVLLKICDKLDALKEG